ncbi:MAG: DUF2357 domain-containing protein [Deltaproteobacteria bacterium]|nr:DUF2357 domain-containing protein [Deltaproteobacteria bacterium]
MAQAEFSLVDEDGRALGSLIIHARRRSGPDALRDFRNTPTDDGIEPVQLVEGCEYRFELKKCVAKKVRWRPSELFDADDDTGRAGRLRTKLSTGRVSIVACVDGQNARPVAIEVRSIKLDYLDDYRQMLTDIAQLGSELVLERFAASDQRLSVDEAKTAETLYQRFVFLQALLRSGRLESGLRRILAAPHVAREQVEHLRRPGEPMRGGGALARRLCALGPRVDWVDSPIARLDSLPRTLVDERTDETFDNVPNRFVKHALTQWRTLVGDVRDALVAEKERSFRGIAAPSGPVRRGLAETDALEALLDDHLRHPMFTDVGSLDDFPGSNQVLQKGDGYRDVLETYVLYEFGSKLEWAGGEDVFGAGQRNVAALYEYWVFLELARIVAAICQVKPDMSLMVKSTPEAVCLILKRGEAHSVAGTVTRRGRTHRVELWFNRTFEASASGGSWTREMRPDCSLCIRPADGVSPEAEELWLHFDAKYRVDRVALDSEVDEQTFRARGDDLLKMHAYRDAIVRAAGAYVVYPGNDHAQPLKRQHAELLPSLGAFPLRPGKNGEGEGAQQIRQFLDNVIDQLAEQGSSYERARFWNRKVFAASTGSTRVAPVPFLDAPAADTLVLIGFLRGPEHSAWVDERCLYNVRADSERRGSVSLASSELGAAFLLTHFDGEARRLFRVVGSPMLMTRTNLLDLAYPEPGGQMYFVLPLEPIAPPEWMSRVDIVALQRTAARTVGSPFAVSWLDLAQNASQAIAHLR